MQLMSLIKRLTYICEILIGEKNDAASDRTHTTIASPQ
jgi:hypothetical protein